jgi:quercetin dioxygenase-like cupin family protein
MQEMVIRMASSFADRRGLIEDILDLGDECLNGVITRISTWAGEVRGNHTHKLTTQWTYIESGRLLVASPSGRTPFTAGSLFVEAAGVPHAWRAEEDTVVLVFTKGPRSGENYESDTERLAPEDHLL